MNSFWMGFEKTANIFSKLKPTVHVQHSLGLEAERQVMNMINHAHERLQSVISNELKNTFSETVKQLSEAKKFRARDILIPAAVGGVALGFGTHIGKKMGKDVTEQIPAQAQPAI